MVVVEVVREVAVQVDAVADRDLVVAVVVVQVLAPEPRVLEGVLVAVGVGDRHEPELGLLEQVPDPLIVGPPAIDVPVHQSAVDLAGDPLPRVLGGAVEDRGPTAVGLVACALGQLDSEDVAPLNRVADVDELGDLRVAARDLAHLILEAPRLVPGTPDLEAVGRLRGGELPDRLATPDSGQRRLDAFLRELRPLRWGCHQVDRDSTADLPLIADVEALFGERGDLVGLHDSRVGVELLGALPAGGRSRRGRRSA